MKPQLAFLHGWGQSSRAWFAQQPVFPEAIYLDLPGHGGATEAEEWTQRLTTQLPEAPLILIGWSLGGILALELATGPVGQRLRGLVLLGTTPCFMQRPDWCHGCDAELMQAFERGIEAPEPERAQAMSRFFMLMLHGDDLSRKELQQLACRAVDRRHPPSQKALRHGLELLRTHDLRSKLGDIRVPTLVIHGERDAVVPAAAGRYLAEHIPQAAWKPIPGCGHAPQMTCAQAFNETLEAWCQNLLIEP